MENAKRLSNPNPAEIRQLVLKKVQEERKKHAPNSDKNGEGVADNCPSSSDGVIDALYRNQDGDAELYVELHRDLFCFDTAAGSWYKWAGHYWQEDVLNDALRHIDAVVEVYGQELDRLSNEQTKEIFNESRKIH
jgi:putative DNA primase/helicase